MGSKISVLDEASLQELDTEEKAGMKRYNTRTNHRLLLCCKSPVNSSNISLDLTPEYELPNTKRSRKCLNIPADDNKENRKKKTFRKNKIFPNAPLTQTQSRCKKTANKGSYLASFFKVFDDDVIQDFLWMDSCHRLSDKYLLSMVYTYFRRANLTRREYSRTNFFAALYLSHDMEEDNEDLKLEIFPWVLGNQWRETHLNFINHRDALLQRMGYRAVVSKVTCDEIMDLCPSHPIWKRERKQHHGGAVRLYDDDSEFTPRGPDASPLYCSLCEEEEQSNSSPTFTSGYLSLCSNEMSSLQEDALHDVNKLLAFDGDTEKTHLFREE